MGPRADAQAAHLCVLVHGFYGGPDNMRNIAKSLQDRYGDDELHVLVAKSSPGSLTADGIDRCAERLCVEIEEELAQIGRRGGRITKFSIVGYSFGGLIARYAIGLLHAGGFLDTVECKNFTTFVTPHLGVRNPAKGLKAFMWNVVASRARSISGKEMFALDTFRDTGRPVLALLADPDSVFVQGLRRFQRLSLYANITNDRNTDYYTTSIQRVDPFVDLQGRTANYRTGYNSVMLDPAEPLMPLGVRQLAPPAPPGPRRWLKYTFGVLIGPIFIPLLVLYLLVHSVVESVRSSFRINRHDRGAAGISIDKYRAPLLGQNASRDTLEYGHPVLQGQNKSWMEALAALQPLALDNHQLVMVDGLDTLSWRRHPVWIRREQMAHEAIIVGMENRGFDEGRVVLEHFANDEFLV